MVLTNFECWAHGDSGANFEMEPAARMTDPFNPRAVASASNGYYGYAFVNDANNNNNNNNNINSTNNNNNNSIEQTIQVVATPPPVTTTINRCKKRCSGAAHADAAASMDMDNYISAIKRCRYDADADLAAQYCNDFFSLPATQLIGTQACLMDYEMDQQQPQQQYQQQQQQQQQPPPRSIHQHYQDSDPTDEQPTDPIALKPLKNNQIIDSDEADLYIATHGGCLHHFNMLNGEHEEFDI